MIRLHVKIDLIRLVLTCNCYEPLPLIIDKSSVCILYCKQQPKEIIEEVSLSKRPHCLDDGVADSLSPVDSSDMD